MGTHGSAFRNYAEFQKFDLTFFLLVLILGKHGGCYQFCRAVSIRGPLNRTITWYCLGIWRMQLVETNLMGIGSSNAEQIIITGASGLLFELVAAWRHLSAVLLQWGDRLEEGAFLLFKSVRKIDVLDALCIRVILSSHLDKMYWNIYFLAVEVVLCCTVASNDDSIFALHPGIF